jgi:protein-L-isoaspartate(D-aspartate) O-methyltransferase
MPTETLDFAQLRRNMVDNQLRTYSITDRTVLDAMGTVQRELFVPAEKMAVAYSDLPLEIRSGKSIRRMLSPMVLARMAQAAEISRTDRILDVGGAAGCSAALLARLGAEVIALESDDALVRDATANLARAGVSNARAVSGPLEAGFAAAAPYDVIFVNGKVEVAPEVLLGQLTAKGRLVAIRPLPGEQTGRAGRAVVFQKTGSTLGEREVFDAAAQILPGFQVAAAFAF